MTDLAPLLENAYRLVRARMDALVHRVEARIATKTIGQVLNRYREGLESLVYETFNHRMDAIDMRRDMKALIRSLAPDAIQEGWREGGLSENDIEDEDQQWADEGLANWIADQVQYVNSFAAAAYAAGDDKDKRQAILARIALWVTAMQKLGELAKAYALRSTKVYWKLGDRMTHTPDCVKLSQGKPHRLQWFIERGYVPPVHLGCGCSLRTVKDHSVIMGE